MNNRSQKLASKLEVTICDLKQPRPYTHEKSGGVCYTFIDMQALKVHAERALNWLRDHKRSVVGVFCVLTIMLVVVPAFGQDGGAGGGGLDTFERFALWIARLMSYIAIGVVKLIVLLIDVVLIPIMRYNEFSTSPIVAQGWVVVRDLVNMFFVVVLLLIAFQTILGLGRADWKTQVPRLLIMAVVINFSRTIAGVLIDFGQVVMITFVNAIQNVAGGNFIQLFGLDELFKFSETAVASGVANGSGMQTFDFLIAAFLTLILTFVILASMVILSGLLAFRIVILWCLIIMAPLTFFLGGAKGVIGPAGGHYADWWKRFTGAVTLGPILTFFIWLALAAASAGNLAETQGFDTTNVNEGETETTGLITAAFEAENMTSLIIAVALLFAGIEVSQSSASAIGSQAGKIASGGIASIPGLARTMGRMTAGAPLAAAGAAKKAGMAVTPIAVQHGIREGAGSLIAGFGQSMSAIPVVGGVGRSMRNAGLSMKAGVASEKEHERAEAAKANAGLGKADLMSVARTPDSAFMGEMDKLRKQDAAIALLNSKKKLQALSPDEVLEFGRTYHDVAGELPDDIKDKFGKNALMMAPQIAGEEVRREDFSDEAAYREARKNKIKGQLGVMAQTPGDLLKIESQAFQDQDFLAAMQETKGIRGEPDKSVMDWMESRGKPEQKLALQGVLANREATARGELFSSAAAVAGIPRGTAAGDPALTAAIADLAAKISALKPGADGKFAVPGALNSSSLTDPNIARTVMENAKPALLQAMLADPGRGGALASAIDADNVGELLDSPNLTPENKRELTSSPQTAKAINDALDAVDQKIMDDQPDADLRAEELAPNAARRLDAGLGAGSVGYNREAKSFDSPDSQAALIAALAEKPELVVNLGDALKAENFGGQIGAAVAQAMKNVNVPSLGQRVLNAGSQVEQTGLINAINTLERALRADTSGDAVVAQKLGQLINARKRMNI